MSMVYSSAINITADYRGAPEIQKARRDMDGLGGTVKGLGSALKALAGAWAVKEIAGYLKNVVDLGDQLKDLSRVTGLSVEVLDSLKGAAAENGIAFEELEGGLKKFAVNMAARRSEFKALGLTTDDTSKALLQLADKFQAIQSPQEKAALSAKLFGKNQSDLTRILEEGGAALKDYGSGFDKDFADKADAFNDTLSRLNRNFTKFGVEIASKALPPLQEFADVLVQVTSTGKDSLGFLDIMSESLRQLGVVAVTTVQLIRAAFEGIKGSFGFGSIKNLKDIVDQTVDVISKLEKNSLIFGKSGAAPPKQERKISTGTASVDLEGLATLQKEQEAVQKLIVQKNELAQLRDLEARSIGLSTAEYEKEKISIEENQKASKELVQFKNSDQKRAYMEATNAIIAEKQALIDLQEQQKQSFVYGAQAAMKEYVENARNVAAQSKQLFTRAFSAIEDSLVAFVRTGKLSFADLANTIADELARIAIRQAIIAPLIGLIGGAIAPAPSLVGPPKPGGGFAMGGIMTSHGPMTLRRYASGGVASSPQLALFGEGSQNEAYVPLPDGRRIPVAMQGAGGGGVNVVVNVNVAKDGSSTQNNQGNNDKARELGNAVAAQVRTVIIEEKRPGGLLST